MMKTATTLIIAGYILTMLAFGLAVPEHVADSDWPAHARNHALQALFWIEGFCLLGLLVAVFGLRNQLRWAWWASLFAGLFIYGGYLLAVPITQGGAPGVTDDLFFTVLGLAHGLGLALSAKACTGVNS